MQSPKQTLKSRNAKLTVESLESRRNPSGLVGGIAPTLSNNPPPVSTSGAVAAVTSGSANTGDLNTQVSTGTISATGGATALASASGTLNDTGLISGSYTIDHGDTIGGSTTVNLDAFVDPNVAYDVAAQLAATYAASADATVGLDADASASWAASATASVDAAVDAWASVAAEAAYNVDVTSQDGDTNVVADSDVENIAAGAGAAATATADAAASATAGAEANVTPTVDYNADATATATGAATGALSADPHYGIG